MRILHTVPDRGWSGREQRLLETAQWQAAHGHSVWIAAPRDNDLHRLAANADLSVEDFPSPTVQVAISSLRNIVRRHAIDIVDVHGGKDMLAGAMARLPIPVVHTRHRQSRPGDFTRWEQRRWRRLAHVIAASEAVRRELLEQGQLDPRRVSAIGQWADPSFLDPPPMAAVAAAATALGIDRHRPVIACFAMLRPEKGVDLLLQAAARLRAAVPDLQVLIVGGTTSAPGQDEPEIHALRALARDLGIADAVILTGFRNDVNVLLRCADLVILPSRKEAQSKVIPQAFAAGVPVIATSVGGIPELVRDGETGWLVPPEDPATLADSIAAALAAPAERQAMARRARDVARDRLGLATRMQATLAAYRLALRRHAGFPPPTGPARDPGAGGSANPFAGRHLMIIAAHQDDETFGAGMAMRDAARLTIVHTTDGAASDALAQAKGFAARADYTQAREKELRAALRAGGISATLIGLGLREQRTAFHLTELTLSLHELIRLHAPDVILTHTFEGGHPDHDATSFAAHMALQETDRPIPLYEMNGYNDAGRPKDGPSFIDPAAGEVIRLDLSPDMQRHKRRMLDAFVSQQNVMTWFSLEAEFFRLAPWYDFHRRPHPGRLFYERLKLGMTWRFWRLLARRTTRALRREGRQRHGTDSLISLGIKAEIWIRRRLGL